MLASALIVSLSLGCQYRGIRELDLTSEPWMSATDTERFELAWSLRNVAVANPQVHAFVDRWAAENPDDPQVLWRAAAWRWWQAEGEASAALRDAALARAEALLERALQQAPTSAPAHVYAGLVAYERARTQGWAKHGPAVLGHFQFVRRNAPRAERGAGLVGLGRALLVYGDEPGSLVEAEAVMRELLEIPREERTERADFLWALLAYRQRKDERFMMARQGAWNAVRCGAPEGARLPAWYGDDRQGMEQDPPRWRPAKK